MSCVKEDEASEGCRARRRSFRASGCIIHAYDLSFKDIDVSTAAEGYGAGGEISCFQCSEC